MPDSILVSECRFGGWIASIGQLESWGDSRLDAIFRLRGVLADRDSQRRTVEIRQRRYQEARSVESVL